MNLFPFKVLTRCLFFVWVVALFVGLGERVVSAKSPSPKGKKKQSYEVRLVAAALKATGLTLEREPTGKIIEKIVIVRENMIASIDPWPRWLNFIHVKTRDYIVRQELLLQPGQEWDQKRVEESARNLRNVSTLATVRTVACQSKKPGYVIWLVVTKDVWSLKISTDFQLVGTVLTTLGLFPLEDNFLGRRKQLGLEFSVSQLDLSNFSVNNQWTLGQFYYDPRLGGTRLRLLEWARLFLDGASLCGGASGGKTDVWCPTTKPGSVRGFYVQLSLDRPLFSLSSKWAFAFNTEVYYNQNRRFRQNSADRETPLGERKGVSLFTAQLLHPNGQIFAVPRVFDSLELSTQASYTRSFGYRVKHDVTLGTGVYRYQYNPPENFPFDDWVRRFFVKQVLPRSESAAYVSVRYRMRPTTFKKMRNVARYGMTEDLSVGTWMSARISGAVDLNNPGQLFVTMSASLSHRLSFSENLFYFSTEGGLRWQPRSNEIGLPGPWSNLNWSALLRHTSPVLGIGRLHSQALVLLRARNIENSLSSLGSAQGLRGYLSGQFVGENVFRVNVEFRTLPLVLWTLHVGLVAFYDGGGLWGGSDPNRPERSLPFLYRQSMGLGVRVLFPQFSKSMLRFDVGVPLTDQPGPFSNWISLSFNQAF